MPDHSTETTGAAGQDRVTDSAGWWAWLNRFAFLGWLLIGIEIGRLL